MIKIKSIIFIILLFLTIPGCLARYGEDRLNHLLSSLDDLKSECEKNNKELTEDQIKEKFGKPGWIKPVYENNLDLSLLKTLREGSGVLLVPNRAGLYDDMLTDKEEKRLKSVELLSYVYDRMWGRRIPH